MLSDAFDMGNRIHLQAGLDAGRTKGRCGLISMEVEPLIEVDPADPRLCHTCLLDLAMTFVVDEPMDDAIGRGYLPA